MRPARTQLLSLLLLNRSLLVRLRPARTQLLSLLLLLTRFRGGSRLREERNVATHRIN